MPGLVAASGYPDLIAIEGCVQRVVESCKGLGPGMSIASRGGRGVYMMNRLSASCCYDRTCQKESEVCFHGLWTLIGASGLEVQRGGRGRSSAESNQVCPFSQGGPTTRLSETQYTQKVTSFPMFRRGFIAALPVRSPYSCFEPLCS